MSQDKEHQEGGHQKSFRKLLKEYAKIKKKEAKRIAKYMEWKWLNDIPNSSQGRRRQKRHSTYKLTEPNPNIINYHITDQNGTTLQVKMNKDLSFRKPLREFCTAMDLTMDALRFRYDGAVVNHTDTPATLHMEEGDTIEVYQLMTGGGASV